MERLSDDEPREACVHENGGCIADAARAIALHVMRDLAFDGLGAALLLCRLGLQGGHLFALPEVEHGDEARGCGDHQRRQVALCVPGMAEQQRGEPGAAEPGEQQRCDQ